jgi:hypothetical protein
MPAKQPCLCGASDCIRCYPSHFVNGQYLDTDHWCDVCQRFTGGRVDSCLRCNMRVCGACEAEHELECGNGGETKG